MSFPSWPTYGSPAASVNYEPLADDFQPIKRALPPISTEMEGGNQRQRSRPGDDIGTIGQTVLMNHTEFAAFTTWWKSTLSNGTARFTASVWLGTSFVTKTCQFTSDGKPTDRRFTPDLIAVTMTLRVYGI